MLVFDGRSMQVSAQMWNLECHMTSKHAAELTVVFNTTSPNMELRAAGAKHKMFSSSNKETCFVLMSSFGNKRPAIQARTKFNKCGETSTHDSGYTGVIHRHFSQIPRLMDADIASILGSKALFSPHSLWRSCKGSTP